MIEIDNYALIPQESRSFENVPNPGFGFRFMYQTIFMVGQL